MDAYQKNLGNLSLKAKAEKYAKITAKTIISSSGEDSASYGQNAFFYDAAEGLLTSGNSADCGILPSGETTHYISVQNDSGLAGSLAGEEQKPVPAADG